MSLKLKMKNEKLKGGKRLVSLLTSLLVPLSTCSLVSLSTCCLVPLSTCFFISAISSCDRRELTYYMESEIEIHADWSQSGLTDEDLGYGATAIFYPEDGGEPKVVLMGNREYAKVRLPEGRYNVVLFNRSFDDFACIGFRGHGGYHTLEAYASRIESRVDELTDSPETLSADRMEGFEVTEDMLGNYSDVMRRGVPATDGCTLRFTPRKLIEELRVTVHIKGLHNVRSAVATIDGVASSVFLATGQASQQTVTQRFELEKPQYYPGSPFNGTMEATFNSFAFNTDRPHSVSIQAELVDGESTYGEEFSGLDIVEDTDEDGTLVLTLELETDQVPDVEPDDGGGSGFNPDVEDWGEEQDGEIKV